MKVTVVGAGITGVYLAYILAKNGHEVAVYDARSTSYSGTSCNPGGINPLHGPGLPGPMAEFYLSSYQEHLNQSELIANLSGVHFNLKKIDRLFLAFSKEEVTNLKAMQKRYDENKGFCAKWLSPDEVSQQDSRISERSCGGLFTSGNFTVDTTAYLNALKKAAIKLGAIFKDKNANQFIVQDQIVTHIVTDEQEIPVSTLAITNGSWAANSLRALKFPINIQAGKGELLLLKFKKKPFSFDITHGLTGLYQFKESLYWAGGTMSSAEIVAGITEEAKDKILKNIRNILPNLNDFEVISHEVGYRPMSPDKLPIVGKLPNYKNVFIGTGGGSKGVLLSCGIGKALTNIIENKNRSDLRFLSPNRFAL
ncbi:MAG: hypothetical protein COB22_08100 [Cycloclasticus sp.]|nr:MAG: hypothetical protein COB22_08100 [Cycloclasticus sp.]